MDVGSGLLTRFQTMINPTNLGLRHVDNGGAMLYSCSTITITSRTKSCYQLFCVKNICRLSKFILTRTRVLKIKIDTILIL